MPGNSQRKGAIRKSSKRPTAGSGGRVRRGLEGRGRDAQGRRPAQPQGATRCKAKSEREASRRPKKRSAPTATSGSPGATRWSRRCGPAYPVNGVYVAEGTERDGRVREAFKLAADRGISLLEVTKGELDRRTDGAVHQGLAARMPAYEYAHRDRPARRSPPSEVRRR